MSYESILADLPEEFIRKMRNWASANSGGGLYSLMYATTSAYEGIGGDGYGRSHDVVLTSEATDADHALASIPNRYRQAVMLFWQYEGRPLSWLGRRMMVSYHTVEHRVRDGHAILRAKLAANRARANRFHELAAYAVSQAPGHPIPLPTYCSVRVPEIDIETLDKEPTSK